MPNKILVVDDEPDVESLFTQFFRARIKKGELSLVFAENGSVALNKLQSDKEIDVVFTDINATAQIESVLKQRLQAQLQNHFGPTLGASEILILEQLPRSKGGGVLRSELQHAAMRQIDK